MLSRVVGMWQINLLPKIIEIPKIDISKLPFEASYEPCQMAKRISSFSIYRWFHELLLKPIYRLALEMFFQRGPRCPAIK